MDDPTGENRAGAPRMPRVRRSRKEQQEHVRDVLLALGGSPEEFDRTHDPSVDRSASLDSRVAAYTRIANPGRAPTAADASPASTPVAAPVRVERVRRAPRRRRLGAAVLRAAIHAVQRARPHVVHAVRLLGRVGARGAREFVAALRRAAAALGLSLLVALGAAGRVARALAVAARRTATGLKRAPRPARRADHEPEHVTEAVMVWVQPQREPGSVTVARVDAKAQVAQRVSRAPTQRARREAVALTRPLVVARHGVGRVSHALAVALPQATTALTRARPTRRAAADHEPEHVAEAVMAWVQPRPERTRERVERADDERVEEVVLETPPQRIPAAREPITSARAVGLLGAASALRRAPRPNLRTRRAGVALLVAVVAVVAAAVLPWQLNQGDANSTRTPAAAEPPPQLPVPSRSEFSNPREYGAAMTRLALTSGRTKIDGQVACAQDSTWAHWTCQARGKPSLGAYAGVWLMYRCSPSPTAQPAGKPGAVMINCTPQKPRAKA